MWLGATSRGSAGCVRHRIMMTQVAIIGARIDALRLPLKCRQSLLVVLEPGLALEDSRGGREDADGHNWVEEAFIDIIRDLVPVEPLSHYSSSQG